MSGEGPEIERSWVLRYPIDTERAEQKVYHEIGYIFSQPGEMRLVDKRDLPTTTYWITVKSDGNLVRDEWEERIPKWVFDQLWPKTANRRVHKCRYYIMHGEHCLEIDEYVGERHSGLWRLECEFANETEASEFKLPDWVGQYKEVTSDKRYKNKNLALHGLPDDWNKF